MNRFKVRYLNNTSASDDNILFLIKRDITGGCNTSDNVEDVTTNQSVVLENVDLSVRGERSLRLGSDEISATAIAGDNVGLGAFGFEPANGTNTLFVAEGTTLWAWTGSGDFTSIKNDFTTGLPLSFVQGYETGESDVLFVSNGTDNWFRINQLGTAQDLGNTTGTSAMSPPKSRVGAFYRNRFWVLKDNLAYFSSAAPADYSTAFDATGAFKVTVGTEKAIIPLRDSGLIFLGDRQIWNLNPSAVPAADTDKPQKLLDIGCVTGATAVQVNDDVYFLANDGVRSLKTTINDKVQLVDPAPLSWQLDEEFESINWAYVYKASAIFWDNKYFISLPVDNSTTNNEVWVYYPEYKGWMVIKGWNISYFASCTFNGEKRLFGISSTDNAVYRLWTGTSDNGTAIAYNEQSRAENFDNPMLYKSGGELRVKYSGGNGTVVVSTNKDGEGFSQIGTISLTLTGISFPVTFPVSFGNTVEGTQVFHLDNIGKFKKLQVKIYCNSLDASLTILETSLTTFLQEYMPED